MIAAAKTQTVRGGAPERDDKQLPGYEAPRDVGTAKSNFRVRAGLSAEHPSGHNRKQHRPTDRSRLCDDSQERRPVGGTRHELGLCGQQAEVLRLRWILEDEHEQPAHERREREAGCRPQRTCDRRALMSSQRMAACTALIALAPHWP
jgi:hypothetical protein